MWLFYVTQKKCKEYYILNKHFDFTKKPAKL